MASAEHNFTIEQGTTFSTTFQWKDSEGVSMNLTGYKARLQARKSFSAPDALIDATTENGLISLVPDTGEVNITLPASLTTGFNWRRAFYDLELVSSAGVVTRLVHGIISISFEVTKNG